MRYRPINRDPDDPRLSRFIPDDWGHVDHFPLRELTADEAPTQVPVVIGVTWYSEMFHPARDAKSGDWFVAGAKSLTFRRGGHCVCLEPGGEPDPAKAWRFYNQVKEGACVGFAWSRCMSLFNGRELYDARWLWDRAKENDEWPETVAGDNHGTTVRAAATVLQSQGHVDWKRGHADDDARKRATYGPRMDDGIAAYRWATSVEEVHAVLGNEKADRLGAVPFLNSWGPTYPHRAWMPDDTLDRLIHEDGEVAIPTDR